MEADTQLLAARLNLVPREQRPVLCKSPNARARSTLIFVAGMDGRALRITVKSLLSVMQVGRFPPEVNALVQEIWDPLLPELHRQQLRGRLHRVLDEHEDPATMYYMLQYEPQGTLAYPFGLPANPLRRPDLVDLIALFEPRFDVKIIVVLQTLDEGVRYAMEVMPSPCQSLLNASSAAAAAAAAGPSPKNGLGEENLCSDIGYRGRMAEDAMQHITAQLQVLSREYYRVLWYDDMNARRMVMADALRSYLRLRAGAAKKIVRGIRRSKATLAPVTQAQRLFLFRMVGALKPAQWMPVLQDDVDLARFVSSDKTYQEEELCLGLDGKSGPLTDPAGAATQFHQYHPSLFEYY